MTKEERVQCALSREEPDRVPMYDLVSNFAVLSHFAGRDVTVANAPELVPRAVGCMLDCTREWYPHQVGTRTDEQGFVYERRDPFNEWVVEQPFTDTEGAAAFVSSEIDRIRDAHNPATDLRNELQRRLRAKQRYGGTVLPASAAGIALANAYIRLGLPF